MPGSIAIVAMAAAAAFTVGGVVIAPADILDGRAIAGGTGEPLVMLTLTPRALARLKPHGPQATIVIDGTAVQGVIGETTIEIAGSPDFTAAAALARRLSGKDPLPDSLDE